MIVVAVTFLLSIIGYIISLPRNLDLSLILLFWFSIGVLFKESNVIARIQNMLECYKRKELFVLVSLAAISCIAIAISTNYRENWSDVNLFLPLAYLSILAGIYLVILGSCIILKWKLACRVFCKIGCHTVMILALHITIFRVVDAIQTYIYGLPLDSIGMGNMYHNGLWIVLYPIAGVAIPLAIDIIWKYTLSLFKDKLRRKQ